MDKASRPFKVCYGYSRVSHADSFEKGESIPAQSERIQAYYERTLKETHAWGGVHEEGTAVSAFKVPFALRPAGKDLLRVLKPGDCMVVDKIDRLFRSMSDFVKLTERLQDIGVELHIVNLGNAEVRTDSWMGRFVLNMFVMLAEMESRIKSERIKEALAHRRKAGLLSTPSIPAGTKVVPVKGKNTLEWDKYCRDVMGFIVKAKDQEGMTWPQVWPKIEKYCSTIEKRDPRPESEWPKETWMRLYKWETAYRYLAITTPSQIPHEHIIDQAARQYRRVRTSAKGKSKIPVITREELLAMC